MRHQRKSQTRRWPFDSKKRRKVSRISLPVQTLRDVASRSQNLSLYVQS
jgi:hypothetical protein